MAEERDNTNRGALWSARGFTGHVDIQGVKHYVIACATAARSEKAPAYKAIVSWVCDVQSKGFDGIERKEEIVPIWRDTKSDSNRLGYFKINNIYVSLYKNDYAEGESHPKIRLLAAANEGNASSAASQTPLPSTEDDLPF